MTPPTTSAQVRCDPDELLRLMQAGDVQAPDALTRCYGDRLDRLRADLL